MANINVLLLYGGGSSEHEISVISAEYVLSKLKNIPQLTPLAVEITKEGKWLTKDKKRCDLKLTNKALSIEGEKDFPLDFVIPYMHGYPAETGDIQSLFELMRVPYLGPSPEANKLCFNKVSTKLWLNELNIPNTPFTFISDLSDESLEKAKLFFQNHQAIFVKASNQGSSVGCYPVSTEKDLLPSLEKAFDYSPYVLLEHKVKGRELEISVYEMADGLHASNPGEIVAPDAFYSYEEKYSPQSKAKCVVNAPGISSELQSTIKNFALQAFKGLKLRHLSRIDFFLTEDAQVYLNEINTYPGMTSISMFPKMLEANGHTMVEFFTHCIKSSQA